MSSYVYIVTTVTERDDSVRVTGQRIVARYPTLQDGLDKLRQAWHASDKSKAVTQLRLNSWSFTTLTEGELFSTNKTADTHSICIDRTAYYTVQERNGNVTTNTDYTIKEWSNEENELDYFDCYAPDYA